MWKYGTQNIREHRSWTDDDGIQHPPNWHIWSAEEKAAAGLTEVTPETPPDSRLYTWGYEADGVTIVKTPKSLDDVEENGAVTLGVKATLIAQVKEQQGSLLSQTDWVVTRAVETEEPAPDNIAKWRSEIRKQGDAMEAAITKAANTAAVAALFLSWDADGNKSGILYDCPDPRE